MSVQKRIVTCLSLGPRAAAVAAEGARMASLLSARPVYLHVGEDSPQNRSALGDVLKAAHEGQAIPEHDLLLRAGHPYSVIRRTAAETKAELVVLGALPRDPLRQSLWGSTARRVARGAPCSVLLLSDPRPHPRRGDTVVAGLSVYERSETLVNLLLDMAKGGGVATIHFVREFAVSEAHWAVGGTIRTQTTVDDFIATRVRSEREGLVDYLSGFDLEDVAVRAVALPGREGTEILAYAREQRADLLVVEAPRRWGRLWGRFVQHPAEIAIQRLTCAVLIHRDSTH